MSALIEDTGDYSTVAGPKSHYGESLTADEQDDLPEVDERLYLRLWLPPVLGRRLSALVRKTSQFELLPGKIEVSARDLQVASASLL